jgi:hypothetical protein
MRQNRWCAAMVGGAILFLSAQAFAQTCPIAASDEEARTLARENFSAAQEAYEMGRPLRALVHYQCSYRLVPHQATLYNLAVLAQGIGENQVAIDSCREFLQRFPAADEAGDIAERLATLEEQQAPPPPPPVEPSPPVELSPPPPPPAPPQEQTWVGPSTEPEPTVQPEPQPEDQGSAGRVTTGRVFAWTTMGLGVAVAAVGAVFMGLSSGLNDDFHQEIDAREISLAELNEIGDQGWNYYVTSWVLMGAGAAFVVTSIALFAAIPGRTSPTLEASNGRGFSASFSPYFTADNGFGLNVNGRF